MTTDVKVEDVTNPELDDSTVTATTNEPTTLEAALKLIKDLQSTTQEKEELVKKVRKYEKEARTKAETALLEQGKFKELYEAELAKRTELETTLTAKAIDAQLLSILEKSNLKSVNTVMKLLDKSKIKVDGDTVDAGSVKVLIDELKKSDPVLFEVGTSTPKVERASEGIVVKDMKPTDKIAAALNKLTK